MAKRVVGAALTLLLGAAVLGLIYEEAAERRFLAGHPPPGTLVDAGGWRAHLLCHGRGSPAVMVEAGAGGLAIQWSPVTERIALRAGVMACSYDRAGLGWSDPAPSPRTVDQVVRELGNVVRGAGITGPLVLVGHSYGGWIVRLFRAQYPDRIAGLALVEAAHEHQWDRLPKEALAAARKIARSRPLAVNMARFGVLRLMADDSTSLADQLGLAPVAVGAALGEMALGIGEAGTRVAASGRLDDLPVTVVTASRSFEAFAAAAPGIPLRAADSTWMALQAELAALSSTSRHIVVDATHNIAADQPDSVAAAVVALVERVRLERRIRAPSTPPARPPPSP